MKTIGLADNDLISNAYQKAYKKRLQKADIDTTQFKDDFNLPEADFENKEKIDYEQKTGKLNLTIIANDKKAFINRYNVWVNEIPVLVKQEKL
jgi:hypothetical protein